MQVKFSKYVEETFTTKGGKEMTKGTLVGNKTGQYDDLVAFTLWNQEAMYTASQLKEGAVIDVKFDIKAREWTKNGVTKYFTDATAFGIDTQQSIPTPQNAPSAPKVEEGEDDDGLPF